MDDNLEYIYFEEVDGVECPAFSVRGGPSKFEDQTPCIEISGQRDLIEVLLDVIFPIKGEKQ